MYRALLPTGNNLKLLVSVTPLERQYVSPERSMSAESEPVISLPLTTCFILQWVARAPPPSLRHEGGPCLRDALWPQAEGLFKRACQSG